MYVRVLLQCKNFVFYEVPNWKSKMNVKIDVICGQLEQWIRTFCHYLKRIWWWHWRQWTIITLHSRPQDRIMTHVVQNDAEMAKILGAKWAERAVRFVCSQLAIGRNAGWEGWRAWRTVGESRGRTASLKSMRACVHEGAFEVDMQGAAFYSTDAAVTLSRQSVPVRATQWDFREKERDVDPVTAT